MSVVASTVVTGASMFTPDLERGLWLGIKQPSGSTVTIGATHTADLRRFAAALIDLADAADLAAAAERAS